MANRRPLILAYHALEARGLPSLSIAEIAFRHQLSFLRSRGYVGYTLSDAERLRERNNLPPRSVVITFDDGFKSTLRAKVIMDEFGFPGTVFIVTSFVANGLPLTWYGLPTPEGPQLVESESLDWQDVDRLAASGWEIGSHSATHPRLATCAAQTLTDELEASKCAIADALGTCQAIAYPYGESDRRVADAAQAAGYRVGCTLTGAHLHDDPLLRPRVGMASGHVGLRLGVHLSRASVRGRRSIFARAIRGVRPPRTWLPPR
jgi:peptidoglycan/xylan/chitin deacetylase (PgdA/CDA1 family)